MDLSPIHRRTSGISGSWAVRDISIGISQNRTPFFSYSFLISLRHCTIRHCAPTYQDGMARIATKIKSVRRLNWKRRMGIF